MLQKSVYFSHDKNCEQVEMSRTPFFRTKGKGCVFFILPQCSLGLLTPFGQKVGLVNLTKWCRGCCQQHCLSVCPSQIFFPPREVVSAVTSRSLNLLAIFAIQFLDVLLPRRQKNFLRNLECTPRRFCATKGMSKFTREWARTDKTPLPGRKKNRGYSARSGCSSYSPP